MSSEHSQADRDFFLRWVRGTFAGWLLGFLLLIVGAIVGDLIGMWGSNFIVGIGMGAGVGYAQGRMRSPVSSIPWLMGRAVMRRASVFLMIVMIVLAPAVASAQESSSRIIGVGDAPSLLFLAGRGARTPQPRFAESAAAIELDAALGLHRLGPQRSSVSGWAMVGYGVFTAFNFFLAGTMLDLLPAASDSDTGVRYWTGGLGVALGAGIAVWGCKKRGCYWGTKKRMPTIRDDV